MEEFEFQIALREFLAGESFATPPRKQSNFFGDHKILVKKNSKTFESKVELRGGKRRTTTGSDKMKVAKAAHTILS